MGGGVRRVVVTAAVLAVLLAACGLPGAGGGDDGQDAALGGGSTTSGGEGEGDADAWTGTITMFAQQYTPNAQVANDLDLTALADAAAEYEDLNPGVTIEFVDDQFDNYLETVRTTAAAGELWDVFWGQWAALNGSLPDGIAYDLAPAFEEPNPYAEGFDTWADAMNQQVIATTRSGDGESFNINGDYVLTNWYYNRDLFEQAGVTGTPTTWEEFVELCRTLSEQGITPVAFVPYYGWMQRHFLTDAYAEDYDRIAELDGSPGYSTADEALAIDEGILSPEDPRFMAWWPVLKQATDLWRRDYITAPSEQNELAQLDFLAGQAAMFYSGSFLLPTLEGEDLPFEYGTFTFPEISADTYEYGTDADVANAVGGPNAAYQFAISTPQANRTMEEPGKPEAVLDWVRFIGTPDVSQRVVNEVGQFLPTFADTQPLPAFQEVADVVDDPWRSVYVGFIAPNLDADIQRVFGSYLAGNVPLEQAAEDMQRLLDTAAQAFIEENDLR